jgi:hypothetical protein
MQRLLLQPQLEGMASAVVRTFGAERNRPAITRSSTWSEIS